MTQSLIVYGPQGCGKTRNAEALREGYGLDRVIEDWDPNRHPYTAQGILYLCVERPRWARESNQRCLDFLSAMAGLPEAGAPITMIERTEELDDYVHLPTTGSYGTLAEVLYRAYLQAADGKGKERHAVDGVAFEDQPMATINRQLGSIDGFIYQAHKKSLEAKRLSNDAAQRELLGAINYLAGAVIALRSWAGSQPF
jgi:hypothetical protein